MTIKIYIIALAYGFLAASQCIAQSGRPDGKVLFRQHGCSGCHGKEGKGPYDLTRGLESKSNEDLKAFIKDPSVFGNRTMPPFKTTLSEPEIESLASYVRSLGKKSKDR
jgi:mono/diheme cytochrome c family protein